VQIRTVRFWAAGALLLGLVTLASGPGAFAQTCNPSLAQWTITVPVGSPPVYFSFAPFAHPPQPPETSIFTNMFTDQQ